mmetsp:Transcript_44998/g.128500  ORF Transcript_44998/g.128500 Transcript_44998/m.128500 type:complete len:239 (-) Transcript_44998:84-800(-)
MRRPAMRWPRGSFSPAACTAVASTSTVASCSRARQARVQTTRFRASGGSRPTRSAPWLHAASGASLRPPATGAGCGRRMPPPGVGVSSLPMCLRRSRHEFMGMARASRKCCELQAAAGTATGAAPPARTSMYRRQMVRPSQRALQRIDGAKLRRRDTDCHNEFIIVYVAEGHADHRLAHRGAEGLRLRCHGCAPHSAPSPAGGPGTLRAPPERSGARRAAPGRRAALSWRYRHLDLPA